MSFFDAKIIVFEGVDGSGKTTQIKLLKRFLESAYDKRDDQKVFKVYTTREPGGSPLSEKIRKLFLHHEKFSLETQILLCSAARNEHLIYLEELQRKEKFDFIIFDRFIDSTLAYQIYQYNLSPKLFFTINREMKLNIDIECEFILDMDPAITAEKRKHSSDYYDSNIELLRRVRQVYLDIQRDNPEKILIDSNYYPKVVNKQILRYIQHTFPFVGSGKNIKKKPR